jgi:general secretion pathway protein I
VAIFLNNRSSKNNQSGLTLIEVLIALAIVSIAMTAIIKATAENIRATSYLQKKTFAQWLAQNKLNEAQAGIYRLPSMCHPEAVQMLNRQWYWCGMQTATPNPHIKKMRIEVFTDEQDANDEQHAIIQLQSYLYAI